jgi:hypothetical protein
MKQKFIRHRKIIIIMAVAMLFARYANAQITVPDESSTKVTETTSTTVANETTAKPMAKIGTYSIFGLDSKFKQAFTDETFIFIEEQRKEHEDVTVALNFGVAVFIPSRDAIAAPTFKPLPQFWEQK